MNFCMYARFATTRLMLGVLAVILSTSLWARISAFLEGAEEDLFVAPTYAVHEPDSNSYRLHIHAWVFEPEPDSTLRGLFVKRLQDELELDEESPDARIFERRMRRFLVDNERLKKVIVEHGEQEAEVGRTAANGHVEKVIRLPAGETPKKWLDLRIRVSDDLVETQRVPVLSKEGIAVVSDIDDTIKDSKVLDRKKLLEKTFMKEFKAVPGMAASYQKMQSLGASFHYLSSSPWQLFEPLDEFRSDAGFPAGTFHLRIYRPKSIGSNLDLVGDSQPHKLGNLRRLLTDLDERQFVLIGDSGEKDPEIYGAMAREFPGRVKAIYIRKVEGADLSRERFEQAFEGIDAPHFVFENPSIINVSLPE